MVITRHMLVTFSLLALGFSAFAEDRPMAKPGADVSKPAPANSFQGRIERVDIDGRRITMSGVTVPAEKQAEGAGAAMTFAVAEHARIWLDGREAQLRDLHEGFAVRVETRNGSAPAGRAKTPTTAGHETDTGELRTVDRIDARSR
jgi:hypothetical protein